MTSYQIFQQLLHWKEPADEASDQMLRLQLDNLETKFQTIGPPQTPDVQTQNIYDRIQKTFAARASSPNTNAQSDGRKLNWEDAYRLESDIACLLSGERLKQEIASRLGLATLDQIPNIVALQTHWSDLLKTFTDKIPDDVYRDFLLEVLNAMHWQSRRKHTARKLRGQATRRTLLFGLMALLAIIVPLFFVRPGRTPASLAQLASITPDNVFEIAFVELSRFWANLPLCMALLFGFMGAIFSRLVTLQTQWDKMAFDELYTARTRSYIFLRATIGTVGALVVYVFLQSGLVKGNVFPTFHDLSMKFVAPRGGTDTNWPMSILLPSGDLALLAMWCFIAGFSEKFVPTILSNTEQQFSGAVGRGS